MAKLKLKISINGDELTIFVDKMVGLPERKTDGVIHTSFDDTLILDDTLVLGDGGDYETFDDADAKRDMFVNAITMELFNGQVPTVDGEDYIWQN